MAATAGRSRAVKRVVQWGVALVAAALALGGGSAAYAGAHKTVMVNVDGASRPVTGLNFTTTQVLDSAGISLGAHDRVTPAVGASVGAGQTVRVERAHPVWALDDHGAARRVWVTGTAVSQQLVALSQQAPGARLALARLPHSALVMPLVQHTRTVDVQVGDQRQAISATGGATPQTVLAKAGIQVGPLDEVVASISATGTPHLTITRVGRSQTSEDQEIPFAVTKQPDPSLFKGQQEVLTPGVTGIKRVVYATASRDGKDGQRQVIHEEVVRQPVTQVVREGTKELPAQVDPQQLSSGGGTSPEAAKAMAAAILPEFGFGMDQYQCLVQIWNHESGWNYTSTNRSSGAYGIPQSLPGSKMASAGADWRTNPATQIRWGLGYIKGRYGSPCQAWASWQVKKWY